MKFTKDLWQIFLRNMQEQEIIDDDDDDDDDDDVDDDYKRSRKHQFTSAAASTITSFANLPTITTPTNNLHFQQAQPGIQNGWKTPQLH